MMSKARKQAIKDQLQALALALGVHLLMVGVLVLGSWNWQPFEQEMPPVQVTLVDMGPVIEQRRAEEAEREARQAREQQQREAEAERQRQAEAQAREEAERQRQAEEEARQAEQRRAEEEARRQAQIERRERELEEQRQAQQAREEQRRQAEEERRQEEEERLRELAELRAQREEAERRRQDEERRLSELAERRQAEEAERRAVEEAERLRLAEEQAQADARRATLREEYIITIRTLVTRNWRRPPTTRPGVACTVRVFQIPGGEIIAAEVVRPCNADEATRRSIIAAVNRVGELPYRGYESVFSREIEFVFRFDG